MTEPHYKGMTANAHGIGGLVEEWNQAVDADRRLYTLLVEEEAKELSAAVAGGDLAEIVKEACDVVWTAVGVLTHHGIDFNAAFGEVFRSNMSKVGPDGEVERRLDGKILKGPRFEPVDPVRLLGRGTVR